MLERARHDEAEAAQEAEPSAEPERHRGRPSPAISNRALARSLDGGRLDQSLTEVLGRASGRPLASRSIRAGPDDGRGSWANRSRISLGAQAAQPAEVLAHEAVHLAQFGLDGPVSPQPVVEAEARDRAARLRRGQPLAPITARPEARSHFADLVGELLGMTVQDVIDSRDGDRVSYLSDAQLAATSWTEWRALIDEIHYLRWVSNRNERDLERLWGTLSADQLLDRPGEDLERWKTGIDRGADLYETPAMRQLERQFEADVQQESLRCLRANRALLAGDRDALGIGGLTGDRTADQEENLQALQDLAVDVMELQQATEELRDVKVGYDVRVWPVAKNVYRRTYSVATFDPRHAPIYDHDGTGRFGGSVPAENRIDGLAVWSEVKDLYDPLAVRLQQLKINNPGIFALLEHGRGSDLSDLAAGTPEGARSVLARVMGQVDAKAIEAIEKVSTGDIDPLDLTTIHRRLTTGHAVAGSGRDWASEMGQLVAAEIVRGHQEAEFWWSLGLATLAAAAFVVAELATFGTATFFIAAGVGLGLTAAQVGSAWEHADDMADASDATYDPDNAVVTRAQAEAARTAAIVESAFGFLDALGPAAKGIRTIAAARRATPVVDVAQEGAERATAEAAEDAAGEVIEDTAAEAAEDAAGEVVEDASGRAARESTAEGAEGAGREAAEDAAAGGVADGAGIAPASVGAGPAPAANMADLADVIGRSIDDLAEPPPGYRFFHRDGKRFIRRITADDARFAKLGRDPSGLIVVVGRAGTAGTRMIPLSSLWRPMTLTDDMIVAAMDLLAAAPALLRRKLGSFTGAVDGAVNSGHLGNLKGNIGEILARNLKDEELDAVRRWAPDAEAFDSVKARYTGSDGRTRTVEFTDGVIASRRGDGLQIHNVIEVKARPRGGANAQSQIHRWIEKHLDDGFEIIVDGQPYTYMPGVPVANPAVGLARAPRTIIAPRSAETLGLGLPEQIAPSVTRRALDYTDEDLRYLVRLAVEELL